ncbi:hypothetical protein EMN47_20195 [Prolixibacteraceae bacterium JC049]|nr:hypothetical protein [Prolixibacteraceae bacterium JC049]
MQYRIYHMIILISLGIILTNCSIRTKKESHSAPKINKLAFADSVWIKFRDALQERQLDYLINNSFDSIQCIDCLPDSLKTKNEIYFSRDIYKQYLKELMHLDSLNSYDYTIFENDTMIYVNYSIQWKYAEEGAYGLHYIFKKSDNEYLFSGMITTP